MLAVQLIRPGRVDLVQLDPPAAPDMALVRPEVMGICGTDTKVMNGDVAVSTPRLLGHEMVGRVVGGPDGTPPPGTRVLVDPAVSCGRCEQCARGRTHLCPAGGLMGRDVDGVFAELVAVDPGRLVTVPEAVGPRAAGLLQVLGTCVHGLAGIEVPAGEVAVVIGLGVTGQLMARLLARAGATVVGITRSEGKRAVAAAHAHVVTDPGEAARVVAEVAGRAGPALVVEAVGTEATLAQAIELAGPGADVLAFGIVTDGSRGLPYQRLYHQELTLHGRRAAVPEDYRSAVAMVADGSLVVDDLVTHVHPLGSFQRAREDLATPSALKVLLTPP